MNLRLLVLFGIFLLFSCKSKEPTPISDFKDYEGMWVPYETISKEGTVSTGPFYSNTFFGIYAEGILLQANQQFVPVGWLNETENFIKNDEAGWFDYYPNEKKLVFNGIWKVETKIIKYSENELHLKIISSGFEFETIDIYKLKRIKK